VFCAVDVSYSEDLAWAACVGFAGWSADAPLFESVCPIAGIEPYEPGRFCRRELPCIVSVLRLVPELPEILIIDGYVWLDATGRPGLGAYVYEEYGRHIPVVGIAKTAYLGSEHAIAVVRGRSVRPLYVTSAGIDTRAAAAGLRSMHGRRRIPALLRRVDQLCRNR